LVGKTQVQTMEAEGAPGIISPLILPTWS